MSVMRQTTDFDAFLVSVDPPGTSLSFAGFKGGTGTEFVSTLTLMPNGSIVLGGRTTSTDVQGTVLQPANRGNSDGFLAAYSQNGTTQVFWAFIGGTSSETVLDVTSDADGNLYVCGSTWSPDLIAEPTLYPFRMFSSFVMKLNSTATARLFATYLVGSEYDNAVALAVDERRDIYVGGDTRSDSFPLLDSAKTDRQDGLIDGFLVKIDSSGKQIVYSTRLGGSSSDSVSDMALFRDQVLIAGNTNSNDLVGLRSIEIPAHDVFVHKVGGLCGTVVTPTEIDLAGSGSTVSVHVYAPPGCFWRAAGNAQAQIMMLRQGEGNAVVPIVVSSNKTSAQARTLTVKIAGIPITIRQPGTPDPLPACNVFAGGPGSVGTAGLAFAVQLSAASDCKWVASSNAPWVVVSPVSGTGMHGALTYSVAPNFGPEARSTTVDINNQTYEITQAGNTLDVDGRFVQLLYFSFLGRLPTTAELNHWVAELNRTSPKRYVDVVLGFLNSQEFALSGRFVAGLYVGILARNAEFRGWIYQRDALSRGWFPIRKHSRKTS